MIKPSQAQFITNIKTYFDNGELWLEQLPSLIKACEDDWEIKVKEPFENLSFNYVAPAVQTNGAAAVFKISPSLSELRSEVEALKAWQGNGSVALLKFEETRSAMLLEKLEPGLSFWHTTNDSLAAEVCAGILKKLWATPKPAYSFRTLEDWSSDSEKYYRQHSSTNSPLPWDLVDKAMHLRSSLLQSDDAVLLHGDLHHDNILSAYREPYLAIDPKGVWGSRAYDLASFLMNPTGLSHHPNLDKLLTQRLDIFSEHLNLDKEELAAWGFVHGVLSVCWSLNGSHYPEEPLIVARALSKHFN